MDALSRANEVRALRAQLKRELKARRVSIGALLLDPPPYLETAKVFDIVLALPKVGRVKATKILHSCRVSPSKTFGGLSERQRAELAARLEHGDVVEVLAALGLGPVAEARGRGLHPDQVLRVSDQDPRAEDLDRHRRCRSCSYEPGAPAV